MLISNPVKGLSISASSGSSGGSHGGDPAGDGHQRAETGSSPHRPDAFQADPDPCAEQRASGTCADICGSTRACGLALEFVTSHIESLIERVVGVKKALSDDDGDYAEPCRP